MTLTFGSICSGIEAASVAWEPLGMKPLWVAEVDKAASSVLAYRFPDIPNLGDMTAIPAMIATGLVDAPDVLVGGTPCQAFSIAGRREGLADERGQLTLSYVEIADELDRARASTGREPCITVWENVPGVLSQHDNAFGCFLAALAGDDEPVEPGERPETGKSNQWWSWKKKHQCHSPKWPVAGAVAGPTRTVAWIVRDAQYFGLAQRRRRVFVVASARADFDPAAILFEFDRVRRDSAPRREAGEGLTHATAPCLTSSGRGVERTGDTRGQDPVVAVGVLPSGHADRVTWPAEVACTLNAAFGSKQGLEDQHALGGQACLSLPPVAKCLTTGQSQRYDPETETLIPTIGAVFDDAAIAWGLTTEQTPKFNPDCALTLTKQSPTGGGQPQAVAYAIQERAVSGNAAAGPDGVGVRADDCAYTMEARSVPQSVAYSTEVFDPNQITCPTNASTPTTELCHTLPAKATPPVAYSVALRGRDGGATAELGDDLAACSQASGGGGDKPHVLAEVCVTGSVTHTLKAEGFDGSEDGTGRGHPIVSAYSIMPMNSGKDYKARQTDVSQPLMAGGPVGGNQGGDFVLQSQMAVRRLMPIECERLQGFPDNWTRIPVRHYKQRKITKTRPEHMWERDPDGGWWLMAADGPRYKQLGNSMAVPVMRWLGQRILWWLENREIVCEVIG